MKICIIGTGYVGLVTGTCLSWIGHDVTCVDIDEKKVGFLSKGISPIYEPQLEDLMRACMGRNQLHFSTSLKKSIQSSDACFICVGTPQSHDGSADLKYVKEVAKEIGKSINEYIVVATKSTVPVGTASLVKGIIEGELLERGLLGSLYFDVVSNPEFLKEGDAVKDFMEPDRVVVGCDSDKAEMTMRRVYKGITEHSIIFMDIASAELTKYASNAMLATRISFINEMASLCEKVGADINSVALGMGTDSRIGPQFLKAGPGYGGSCFPKDVRAIINTAVEYGGRLNILESVDKANEAQKLKLLKIVLNHYDSTLKGKTFAVWGLSFKPNTDDVRESSAFPLIRALINLGCKVIACDPIACENAKKELPDSVKFSEEPVMSGVDGIFIVTDWDQFRNIPIDSIEEGTVIFDGRNIYNPVVAKNNGFTYYGIGRGTK